MSTFSHLLSTAPTSTSALSLWICSMLYLEHSEHAPFFEAVLAHHSNNKAVSRIDPNWPLVPHILQLSHIFEMRELLAYCLASTLLDGVEDKQGRPLIEHSFRVYLACRHLSPDQRIAALLHDCVEDGKLLHNLSETKSDKWTIHDVIKLLFGADVSKLVTFLTRPANVTYSTYIRVISNRLDVIPIKLADLRDNLDPTRGPIPDSLRQRYEEAVKVLEAAQADREETAMFKGVYDYTMSDITIYEQRAEVVPPDQLPEPMCRCAIIPIDKQPDSTLITEQEAALDSYSLSSLASLEPPPDSDITYSAECDMVWIGDEFKELG